jgi:hypothetical protein
MNFHNHSLKDRRVVGLHNDLLNVDYFLSSCFPKSSEREQQENWGARLRPRLAPARKEDRYMDLIVEKEDV